jgi:hypothetical protein
VSGATGRRGLLAVLREPACSAALERRLAELGTELLRLDERSSDRDLERALASRIGFWPAPSLCLTDELLAEINRFCSGVAPAVLVARPILMADKVEFPLIEEVVLAAPGSVDVRAGFPVPRRAAARIALRARYALVAPASLEEHLAAIKASSSLEARLRHRAGERASYAQLLWQPSALALRGFLGTRGGRRAALPRIAMESYRRVLVAAKLWEIANVDGSRPVPA